MPFLCHPFGIILLCHPFGKIFFRPNFKASLPFISILHLPIIPNKWKTCTIYVMICNTIQYCSTEFYEICWVTMWRERAEKCGSPGSTVSRIQRKEPHIPTYSKHHHLYLCYPVHRYTGGLQLFAYLLRPSLDYLLHPSLS